jgi:hypothetical protein
MQGRSGDDGGPAPAVRVRAAASPQNQEPETLTAPAPAQFLKGKLTAVDCSSPPGAVLTVAVGAKRWQMTAKNASHMILIGADTFSCDWKNRSVAVNYRETGDGQGDIISLELQ